MRGFKIIIRDQHVAQLVQQFAVSHPAEIANAISAAHHSFLFWASVLVGEVALIVVYASPVVKPTDSIYRPVEEALGEHPMRLVMKETIPDPSMMFGSGELSVYQQSNDSKPDLTPQQFEAFITRNPPPCC